MVRLLITCYYIVPLPIICSLWCLVCLELCGYAYRVFWLCWSVGNGALVGILWQMFGVLFHYVLCGLFGESVIITCLKGVAVMQI